MYTHDDPLACPSRQAPSAGAAPGLLPVVADDGVPLAVVIMATIGLMVTSGCALAPPAAPAAVSTCAVPAPTAAPAAPPPVTAPAVARTVARPVYVRPVVPPLPTDVYQPSAQGAQRRVAVPPRAAESGKTKDDAKS